MTTQAARIAALETELAAALAKINEFARVMQPLAEQVQAAHTRLDHAAKVFGDLRKAVTPKRETQRIPLAEFQRALEDLRADAEQAGSPQRYFPTDAVLVRAATLRTMAANTAAA